MPREEHDYLTNATRDVLTDNVKAAASGWDKCLQYIYSILKSEKRDPYAPFRSMYEGMCRGGVSTSHWDEDMAYIRQRYARRRSTPEPAAAFTDTLKGHNTLFERYLRAIADGRLTIEELDDLEPLVRTEQELIAVLKHAMREHRIKMEKVEVENWQKVKRHEETENGSQF